MLTRRLAREPARPRVAEAGSRIGALRRRWSPVRRVRYAGQRVSPVRNRSSFLVAAAFLCALSAAAAGLAQNPQPQAPPQTQEAEPSPPVSPEPSERGVAAEPERPLPADAGPAVRRLLLVELALLAIVLVGLPVFGWWIGKVTACRSGEVRGARWEEVDLEAREWRIPAERMKANREHRVPLSTGALAVLREARSVVDGSDLVFPSVRGRALSDATISKMVRELGIPAVPHGFRSSFRDWAAECSDAPREVCELALAHVNSDRVEAAYRRTDLFERRRELMEQWAAFLGRS